jgi:MoaA/NifB/PqqE/SkfB family radical SAM enzyme
MTSIRPVDDILKEIDAGVLRGNNYMDITGGEPTLHPNIIQIIKYALSKGVRTCIITNAIVSESKTTELLNSGLDEFLISIHGLEETHNKLTQFNSAREKQIRFLNQIRGKISFRFNLVINSYNQTELLSIAEWMVEWKPSIVNFINFNPHYEWTNSISSKTIVADLRIVEPLLNQSIKLLEDNNSGVNVRYYPMCRISEDYRRCICNDLHVSFDPYEWDYSIQPKTFDAHKNWGISGSKSIENKDAPCKDCYLQNICGGINKSFNQITGGQMIDAIRSGNRLPDDFYYYRKNNNLTLQGR